MNLPAPYRVLESLDRTFRIYRANFVAYIGVAAITTVPVLIGRLLLTQPDITRMADETAYYYDYNPWNIYRDWIIWGVALLVIQIIFQGIFAYGLITVITSEIHLGYPCTITQAIPKAKPRLLKLSLGWLAYALIYGCLTVAMSIASAFCLGFIAFPFVMYLAFCNFVFLAPTIMLEDVSPWMGLRRALGLGKIQFWRVFGFALVMYAILMVIALTQLVLLQLLPSQDILTTIVGAIGDVFVMPIIPIGFTLLYYDIRTRVEGLDIAMGTLIKPDPRPFDVASPPPPVGWLTGKDIANVFLLLLGMAVLFALLIGLVMMLAASGV